MAIGPTTRERTGPRHGPRVAPRRWRPFVVGVAALGLLLVPVPWRLQMGDDPLALTWDLDGRLEVDGELLDPPGRWTWLTVGRPPLAGEVLVDVLDGGDRSSWDIRDGASTSRPAVVEPVAAAAGLRAAGRDVSVGLTVTVSEAVDPRLPERAVLVELNGMTLEDRGDWAVAASRPGLPVTFRLSDGTTGTHPGRTLPWRDIEVADVPPDDLQARLFGNLPDVAPIQWARDHLALGPSHGLMVALTTWAAASGLELDGVHVAGTGGIRGDGVVTPIGGLEPKARAARDDGADLLFFPLPQAGELDGFDPGSMTLVGVSRLEDATRVLESWPGAS
ncbi:hypothetical protein [Salsipaludibacter albus]|uniref:hypothetical protein n=1 Tax=Salsipaludibacter albus TaxID=2849650 RepID=UPI001EE3A57D|nr:hypothetical protein [Salsipaludibacter albus]MBY5163299.1 hypothetical protein [Salsipaludibacter albus]